MDHVAEVRRLALAYRGKLQRYFWGPLALSIPLYWLGAWSDHQWGREAGVLWGILMCAGTVCLFFATISGLLLRRWYAVWGRALADARRFAIDPDGFKAVYKEVIGPFPW